jgi:hypothetical protein
METSWADQPTRRRRVPCSGGGGGGREEEEEELELELVIDPSVRPWEQGEVMDGWDWIPLPPPPTKQTTSIC